jgi:hypothetical protein
VDLRAGCGCLGPPGTGKRAADSGADESMKPGEARVGQKVRTLVDSAAYPEITAGTIATVRKVLTQKENAETDLILIHPHKWMNEKCMPCGADKVELAE